MRRIIAVDPNDAAQFRPRDPARSSGIAPESMYSSGSIPSARWVSTTPVNGARRRSVCSSHSRVASMSHSFWVRGSVMERTRSLNAPRVNCPQVRSGVTVSAAIGSVLCDAAAAAGGGLLVSDRVLLGLRLRFRLGVRLRDGFLRRVRLGLVGQDLELVRRDPHAVRRILHRDVQDLTGLRPLVAMRAGAGVLLSYPHRGPPWGREGHRPRPGGK